MLNHLEGEFNKIGKPGMAKIAAGMLKELKAQGIKDIPFPSVSTPSETQTVAKTPEAPVEIKRFSQEQREALEKQGFVIYGLTGQSIKTLRDAGRKFRSAWHNAFPDFEALGSMHSEVAINPNKPFLPNSSNKTLARQEDMVGKFSEELGKKVKGVKAIIGQAPDYAELAFAHLDSTEKYLFGAEDSYDYARTKTPSSSFRVAGVGGGFHAYGGLDVDGWDRDDGVDGVHAAPLVVPV